jgi:hypothetical protein
MKNDIRRDSRFVTLIGALVTSALLLVAAPSFAQQAPTQHNWSTGASPSGYPPMPNAQQYCWLGAFSSLFANTADSVQLTFDANYNWIFTSAGPDFMAATAFCLPLSAVSNQGGNEFFGQVVRSPPLYNNFQIPAQPGSFCSIAGVGGALARGNSGLEVSPAGYMFNYGTVGGPSTVFGNCVQFFGSSSPPPVTYYESWTTDFNNGTYMGSATNEMCGLYSVDQVGTPPNRNQPLLYQIEIDDDNNYWLRAVFTGVSTRVFAACIPIPQL